MQKPTESSAPSRITRLQTLIEDLAKQAKQNQDNDLGIFVALLFTKFNKFRGPNGEKFGNQFLKELLMGQLATAYANIKTTIQDAQAAAATLADANKQLSAGVGTPTTPKGRTLDTADLNAIDEIIDTYAGSPASQGVPVPQVPQPGG